MVAAAQCERYATGPGTGPCRMNREALPRLPVFGWQAFAGKAQADTPCLLSLPNLHYTTSGRAAILLALESLGVGAGDEVIMPAFTFVASFEAILSVGAIPVLVDVDDTLTLNPDAVKAAITPKTKCIMPVHMCGSMADMDALQIICKEHKLIIKNE